MRHLIHLLIAILISNSLHTAWAVEDSSSSSAPITSSHTQDNRAATPEEWKTRMSRCEQLLDAGQYQQAKSNIRGYDQAQLSDDLKQELSGLAATVELRLLNFQEAERIGNPKEGGTSYEGTLAAGRACVEMGKFANAIILLEQLASTDSGASDKSSQECADENTLLIQSWLARCYPPFDQALTSEGQFLAEHSLKELEKKLGSQHLYVADALENLAETDAEGSDYLKLIRRALEIRKTKLGNEHPEVSRTLRLMAGSSQIDSQEGKKLADEAKQIDEKFFTNSSLPVALDVQLLAKNESDPQKAEVLYKQSSQIAESAGTDNAWVSDSLKAFYAGFLRDAKRESEALAVESTRSSSEEAEEPRAMDDAAPGDLPFVVGSDSEEQSPSIKNLNGAESTRVVYIDSTHLFFEGLDKDDNIIWRAQFPGAEPFSRETVSWSNTPDRITLRYQNPHGHDSGTQEYSWSGKELRLKGSASQDPDGDNFHTAINDVISGKLTAAETDDMPPGKPYMVNKALLADMISRGHKEALRLLRAKNYTEAANRLSNIFQMSAKLVNLSESTSDETEDLENWIQSWDKMKLSANDYVPALNDYGFVLSLAGNNSEAIRVYKRVIKQSPERTVVYINLGDSLGYEEVSRS